MCLSVDDTEGEEDTNCGAGVGQQLHLLQHTLEGIVLPSPILTSRLWRSLLGPVFKYIFVLKLEPEPELEPISS